MNAQQQTNNMQTQLQKASMALMSVRVHSGCLAARSGHEVCYTLAAGHLTSEIVITCTMLIDMLLIKAIEAVQECP